MSSQSLFLIFFLDKPIQYSANNLSYLMQIALI